MSVPVCPQDKILVRINRKFTDTTSGGLFIDTTWKPGQYATVTGTVISTPVILSNHPQKKNIVPEAKAGDEIAFDYSVIYNREYSDNKDDIFSEDYAPDVWTTLWSNRNNLHIIRRNRKGGKFDAALYTINKDTGNTEIIEKVAGDKFHVNSAIENWMNEKNDFIKYRNCLVMDNEEYWMVDYSAAYAVRRGEDIVMLGGYTLLDYKPIPRQEYTGRLELLGDFRHKEKKEMRSTIVSIGKPLKDEPELKGLGPGDTVAFNKDYAQEYNFWGNDYLLIRQKQILAQIKN